MSIYETIDEKGPVSQGDVIKWCDRHFIRPWQTYGIIVTADCDLEWNKYGGRISFVPSLLTEDYILHQWRLSEFQSSCSSHVSKATTRLNTWREKQDAASLDLSVEAVANWLSRVGCGGLLDELGIVGLNDRNTFLPVLEAALAHLKLLNCSQPDLSLLRACRNDADVIKSFKRHISGLPGDVFHLPDHPEDKNDGLFVMLRHITQCDIGDIARTPEDLRFGSARSMRIARVGPPYRYSITQNLARVFADIGLPREYSDLRNDCVDRFFGSRL